MKRRGGAEYCTLYEVDVGWREELYKAPEMGRHLRHSRTATVATVRRAQGCRGEEVSRPQRT